MFHHFYSVFIALHTSAFASRRVSIARPPHSGKSSAVSAMRSAQVKMFQIVCVLETANPQLIAYSSSYIDHRI